MILYLFTLRTYSFIALLLMSIECTCAKCLLGYAKNKLQAKLKKCEFGKPHVKYLGHILGSRELRVDMDKVSAVRDWLAPVDIKGV